MGLCKDCSLQQFPPHTIVFITLLRLLLLLAAVIPVVSWSIGHGLINSQLSNVD